MGINGWLAGEYIAAGLDQAADGQRALRDAREFSDTVDRLVADLEKVRLGNAGNLAEKHALREELRKRDPKNPLLTNTNLQEKIKNAGKEAFLRTKDWDAARAAGDNFKI